MDLEFNTPDYICFRAVWCGRRITVPVRIMRDGRSNSAVYASAEEMARVLVESRFMSCSYDFTCTWNPLRGA